MPVVFISHSNRDTALTSQVAAALKRAGYAVWVDFENIRGGADWLCEIEAGIQRCAAVVTILSASSAASTWVERECLYAMQLKKPVITALVADVLIPLHLINFQYCDLRDPSSGGLAALLAALHSWTGDDSPPAGSAAAMSRLPAESNFFPYLQQLPAGATAKLVAQDLFYWAGGIADEVDFGGRVQPGFHARLRLGQRLLTVFSVWAYRRQPAAQVHLKALARHRPFDQPAARSEALAALNRLLPRAAQLKPAQSERMPTVPLRCLSSAEKLEAFKAQLRAMMDALRRDGR